ncbi:Uu.00g041540.m01.CDS01 [Anthostomella pinea]|uniref:Uu.00g041540.m01.CDS01 n=1 Tax=Anthostomella pinea TaxID=933095 RepID=A0AAI8YDY2_9PEZI|nr:Uu.00g041540.m01.CDS01 [Anthostomella pinea]
MAYETAASACRPRKAWKESLVTQSFDATRDCRDLNRILETVNQDKSFNFCAADTSVVIDYINKSLIMPKASNQPKPCEIQLWWFGGPGVGEAFCRNATDIAVQVYKTRNFTFDKAQPYESVIQAPRAYCHEHLEAELASIGNPDIADQVLTSYGIELALLLLFVTMSYTNKRVLGSFGPLADSVRDAFWDFWGAATLLIFAVVAAALVTFRDYQSTSNTIQTDFGYTHFYEEVENLGYLADAAGALHLCVATMWVIWYRGVRDQDNPVHIVFGGLGDFDVSSFLYRKSRAYTLATCILMTVLPVLGVLPALVGRFLSVLGVLSALIGRFLPVLGVLSALIDRLKVSWALKYSERILGRTFRVLGLAMAAVQFFVICYIRAQASKDARGQNPEVGFTFGQVLALTAWVPLLYKLFVEALGLW